MPSPLGHALGGATVAWLVGAWPHQPEARPVTSHDVPGPPLPTPVRSTGAPVTAEGLHVVGIACAGWIACAALAVLPDADLMLPFAHRTVTHSLSAVAAVALTMIVLGVVTGKVTARFGLACVTAYASHLLLDWLQADPTPPYGIQLIWPMSSAWFISGWDIFRGTERRHLFEAAALRHNAAAMIQEVVILGPVAAAAWLIRVKALAGLPAEVPGGNHPPQ